MNETIHRMRKSSISILVAAAIFLLAITFSTLLGSRPDSVTVGFAGLAGIVIILGLFGLWQTQSKGTLQRMREAAELSDTERQRLAIRNARLTLAVLMAAFAAELPVAYAFWTNEQLLPWLLSSLIVTALFGSLFAVILVRAKRWSGKTSQK